MKQSKSGLTVDPKSMKRIMDKLEAIGGLDKEIDAHLKQAAISTRDKARSKFTSKSEVELKKRREETSGLVNLIRYKTLKRKKGRSAYQVTSGDSKHPIMAYIEFGTRAKNINLTGIKKMFGAEGANYAKRFKGTNNEKYWTHTNAKPYFYNTAYLESKQLMKNLNKLVKSKLKK